VQAAKEVVNKSQELGLRDGSTMRGGCSIACLGARIRRLG